MKFISLGGNCSISYQLKKYGLKNESYPFDWSKTSINQIISVLENNFIDYEIIEIKKKSNLHTHKNNISNFTYLVFNKYNITFAHEIICEKQIDHFKESILRRIYRFKNINENVTFIRIELCKINETYDEKIIKLYNLLKKYVNNFKLIIIINCCYKSKINNKDINIFYYQDFSEDWQMNNIDWNKVLFNEIN